MSAGVKAGHAALRAGRGPGRARGAGTRGHLEEAVKLSRGSDALALHVLGRVYADLGRHAEAIQTERRALMAAIQQGNTRLAQAIGEHLEEPQRAP